MVTLGYRGTCPQCGAEDMEAESRNFDERGECSRCGLFYERTTDYQLAYQYLNIKWGDPIPPELAPALRDDHWHTQDSHVYFRVGFIKKLPETQGKQHIMNTWFTLPSGMAQRPTAIEWRDFTADELANFKDDEWFILNRRL